jgi:EAL domain-containing protein (putative c-di-GMP-specific phosphodiesterase class I)
VEALHLTGPAPAVRRLAQVAARLHVAHEVEGGVLRVPIDVAGAVIDGGAEALAPLEAQLVRVVRVDLASGSPSSLLAVAAAAPTLAVLAGRRRHRRLLQAIQSREGVAVGYQPVIDLQADRPMGFEALLRVRLGSHDVPPSDVLSAAEDAGRLVEVDAVARSEALRESAALLGDRTLFVNVLPASLPVPGEHLAPFLAEAAELGIDRRQLVLEAPVGPAGALRRQVEAVFRATREAGMLVGLDNVRSGRDLDAVDFVPDVVKLDRTMIRSLPSSSGARSVGGIVRDCEHSGAMLVAQGVESPEQVQAVRDLGIRYAQGWALGRPGAMTAAVETNATT